MILTVYSSHAQVGKILGGLAKDGAVRLAKKKGKDLAFNELDKTKAKYDTTSFGYSVSFSDKAGQFENKDNLKDVITVGGLLFDERRDQTITEQVRKYLDVGEMAYASNGFRLAETSFIGAKLVLEEENETNTLMYSRTLADLGMLYNSMGRYGLSEEFTRRALEHRKEMRGMESIDYAASLNNLGVLEKNRGNYNEAEKELTEAIALNEEVSGPESLPYAISLNNRGVLYQILGRYENAEADLRMALTVAANTLKPNSGQYTRLQSNLAFLYLQKGQLTEAEAIFKQAISAISRDPLKSKSSNPDYAHMIENLAGVYVKMGNYQEAENLIKEAMVIYTKKFGTNFSGYGLAAARLGALYRITNDFDQAESMLLEGYRVAQTAYGLNHPVTADMELELALLKWQQGDLAGAREFFNKTLASSVEFIGNYFAPMSESEKSAYWKTLQPRFEQYFAFVAMAGDDPQDLYKALQYRLLTKAMLLSSTNRIKKEILSSGDEALVADYETWLDQKEQLAHYYSMSSEDIHDQGINIDSIESASNSLEKSLSERSGIFNSAYHQTVPLVEDIQGALSSSEAALEIIRVGHDAEARNVRYLGLIVTPNRISKVVLNEGEDLESKYYKAYRNMIRLKREDNYSYQAFWSPFSQELKDYSTVYLSLDGVYNQINPATLLGSDGKYLLEEKQLYLLSSLRELVDKPSPQKGKRTLVLGDPVYGSDKISPLPGTLEESTQIAGLLSRGGYQTELVNGAEATEQVIKSSANERLMHIATHGFFIEDPQNSTSQVFSVPLHNVNENVLLRSGLMLAGAGSETEVAGLTNEDDGILTAYEVLNLDLMETELVVLSACETGLGDVMAGEGVYGLQRAFLVAGTEAIIMSLWKVDDTATQELMVNFYDEWLKTGDKHQAFKNAQYKIKEKYNSPYYWGAFLLVGS